MSNGENSHSTRPMTAKERKNLQRRLRRKLEMRFQCHLCGIRSATKQAFQTHLATQKHRNRVQQCREEQQQEPMEEQQTQHTVQQQQEESEVQPEGEEDEWEDIEEEDEDVHQQQVSAQDPANVSFMHVEIYKCSHKCSRCCRRRNK